MKKLLLSLVVLSSLLLGACGKTKEEATAPVVEITAPATTEAATTEAATTEAATTEAAAPSVEAPAATTEAPATTEAAK